ncbi:MAG TPA: P-loop NTPase fold protein [Jiangellales bacterium]|nr:P-loop NTPase fold protein [Jiangellales bacterium]
MVAAPADRSPSVAGLATQFGDEPVTAGQLVNDLVAHHRNYAGRRAAEVLPFWPEPARRRTAASWITASERLIVDGSGGLNGQLLILLLALVDPPTGRAITESGLVAALLAEYVAVEDDPGRPVGSIVDREAAATGLRASPLLAAMYGLAEPTRLPTTSSSGAEVGGLCWPWSGGPVIAFTDGRVEQVETGLGASSGLSGPVSVGADDVRVLVHQRHGVGDATVPWGESLPAVESGSTGGPDLRVVSRSGQASASYDASTGRVDVTRPTGSAADGSSATRTVPVGIGRLAAMAVTDGGDLVAAVDEAGRLVLWEADDKTEPVTWDHPWRDEPTRPGGGLDVDAAGRLVAWGTADGHVLLVHRSGNGPLSLTADLAPAGADSSPADTLALSPDGSNLLVRRPPGTYRYDLRLGADRLRSGYLNDLASRGRDYAGLDNDVEALAMLVASRQLEPPLSIGLFGDWGTGKSFFLNRLQRRVLVLSREASGSGLAQHQVDYWKHVRCVEFNAWTFAEANLWASLMEEVLAELDAKPVSRTDAAPVDASLVRTTILGDRRAAADSELSARERELAEAQRTVMRSRLLAGGAAVVGLVALVLLAVGLATNQLEVWIGGLGAVAAVLAGYAAAAAALARKATTAAGDAAQATGAVVRPLTRWRQDEGRLRSRQAARDQAAEEVARLDRIEANPARMVAEYIAGRRGSGDYRQHLGLVGMVRQDLKRIDEAVDAANEAVAPERGEPEPELEGEDRLNRIVVFIDDLDRCAPARVVEVLEAVHLLLAYRLFVVVIAVDSRWLQQSLRAHYRDLLAGERGRAATPLDYLEKIVQLPYQLPRMNRGQVTAMISDLVGAEVTAEAQPPPEGTRRQEGAARAAGGDAESVRGGVEDVGAARKPPRVDLQPEGLHVTAEEARWLAGLAPLVGSTPRTVKRFVNAYRVLKARSPLPRVFAAEMGPDSEYRRAAFLLAVLVGCEEYALVFVPALRSGRHGSLGEVLDATRGSGVARVQRDRIRSWAVANDWLDRPVGPLSRSMADVGRFSFVDLLG